MAQQSTACASCIFELQKPRETVSDDDTSVQTTASPRSSSDRSRGSSPKTITRRFEWADEDPSSDDDVDVKSCVVGSSEGSSSQINFGSSPVFMPCVPPGSNQLFQCGGVYQPWSVVPVGTPFMPCAPSACFAQPLQLVGVTFQPVNQSAAPIPTTFQPVNQSAAPIPTARRQNLLASAEAANAEAANSEANALQAHAEALAARAKELREAVRLMHAGGASAQRRGSPAGRRSSPTSTAATAPPATERNSRTTLILKNLPPGFTHDGLRKILDEHGFAGLYNFVYVPFDFKKLVALRYGYVNFEHHRDAVKATAALDGFAGWVVEGEKALEVEWSGAQQGLQAHIERYRNSPVMHCSVPEEYKPVLLENGARIAFPLPTQVVKPPKIRVVQQA